MRCNLYIVLYYYQRSTCFGRFFDPSSGAYKTVCAALGIVMPSCCIPLVWLGSNTIKNTHLLDQIKHYVLINFYYAHAHHHHHISVMELGHLLTRSGLMYPEVSSKVCHDSFCQLENSVSLPWVIFYAL